MKTALIVPMVFALSSCALYNAFFWYATATNEEICEAIRTKRELANGCNSTTIPDNCEYDDGFDVECLSAGDRRVRCAEEHQAWLDCVLTPVDTCDGLGDQDEFCDIERGAYIGCIDTGGTQCNSGGSQGEGEGEGE